MRVQKLRALDATYLRLVLYNNRGYPQCSQDRRENPC